MSVEAAPQPPKFPIYLHSSMMMSFLAYLDDGVADETTVQQHSEESNARHLSGGVKAKLSAFTNIFGLSAEARGSRDSSASDTQITQQQRLHTSASLFNLLHDALSDNGAIVPVDSYEDLEGVNPGDIVEINGRFRGNPLEDSFEVMRKILSIHDSVQDAVDHQNKSTRNAQKQGSKSGNPALRAEAKDVAPTATNPFDIDPLAAAMIRAVLSDLGDSPVADYVLDGPDEIEVVVAVIREECPPHVLEMMLSSEISVIGKVTDAAHSEDDRIDLMRRSSLRVADQKEDIFAPLSTLIGPGSADSRYVGAPAIQLIPMGIFC